MISAASGVLVMKGVATVETEQDKAMPVEKKKPQMHPSKLSKAPDKK